MEKKKKNRLYKSFQYALEGIWTGIRQERNMRIHCGAVILVVFAGIFLKLSLTEWCLCFILFGLILALELMNTALESVVDLVTEEYRPLAKKAKDTAAGAVLVAAVMAAVVGCMLFLPKIFLLFV